MWLKESFASSCFCFFSESFLSCWWLEEDKRQLWRFHTQCILCRDFLCLLPVLAFSENKQEWKVSLLCSLQLIPWNGIFQKTRLHYCAEWYRKMSSPNVYFLMVTLPAERGCGCRTIVLGFAGCGTIQDGTDLQILKFRFPLFIIKQNLRLP